MGVSETRIYPINTGWLDADLGTYIFWKGPAGKKIWNPVYCFYVNAGDHKIMVDTGLCDEERLSATITNARSGVAWKCMITCARSSELARMTSTSSY